MDEPRYKPSQVAAAAGLPIVTLRNWERAGRELIRRETKLFTFRRALQVAITQALVSLGVPPGLAARAAYDFTDRGTGPLPGRPARAYGELFETGWTMICIYPGGLHEVKNVQPKDAATLLFKPLGHSRGDAVTALNITFLVELFRKKLEGLRDGDA